MYKSAVPIRHRQNAVGGIAADGTKVGRRHDLNVTPRSDSGRGTGNRARQLEYLLHAARAIAMEKLDGVKKQNATITEVRTQIILAIEKVHSDLADAQVSAVDTGFGATKGEGNVGFQQRLGGVEPIGMDPGCNVTMNVKSIPL